MTLRPCYRATCDAPGCTAAEYLPHERSGPARLQLAARGWTTVEHYVSASGAARLVYACPAHRDWRPNDDAKRLVGMSMRERCWLRIRRTAMLWMLREAGATSAELARDVGLTAPHVTELILIYDRVIERRQAEAADWIEPWAKRLREAGGDPVIGEGRCAKAPEDVAAHGDRHCVHRRPRRGDLICCWCGDLFIDDDQPSGAHGQYRPRGERR